MNDLLDIDNVIDRALAAGFSYAAPLLTSTIEIRPEVRDACAKNLCGLYGKSWSCPPGCGTLEKCEELVRSYAEGIIVQTTGILEDEYDGEAMMEAARLHGRTLRKFARELRVDFPDMLTVGAGGCTLCEKCTYPDAPCRDPGNASASMEALGMLVSEVCTLNGVAYNRGKNTITYIGCYLLK